MQDLNLCNIYILFEALTLLVINNCTRKNKLANLSF